MPNHRASGLLCAWRLPPGPARPREAAVRRGGAAAPDHARARCNSRTPALQPAEGDDARRGGRHSHAQRPTALVRDGLRAPRAAARIAARPSRPGSGSRMSTDIGCRARSRSAAGKSVRREVRGAKVRWKCRRGPSAARCWPPWAPVQPLAAPPGAPAPRSSAQTARKSLRPSFAAAAALRQVHGVRPALVYSRAGVCVTV